MQVSKSNKLANVCYDIRGPVLQRAQIMEEEGHHILKLNIGNPAPFGFDLLVNGRAAGPRQMSPQRHIAALPTAPDGGEMPPARRISDKVVLSTAAHWKRRRPDAFDPDGTCHIRPADPRGLRLRI